MRTQRLFSCFILLHYHRHGNTAETFNTSHNKCASFTLTRQNCAWPCVLEAFWLFYSQNHYGDRYFNACLCPPRDEEGQDGRCVLPAWDLSQTLADVLSLLSRLVHFLCRVASRDHPQVATLRSQAWPSGNEEAVDKCNDLPIDGKIWAVCLGRFVGW